jgi:hypothetical protein
VSGAELATPHARRIVEARLGRPPQDMLEAAVALEAWVGLPARQALDLGRSLVADGETRPERSTARVPPHTERDGLTVEALAFAVAIVAIGGWAAPLSASLGIAVVEHALLMALPLTLALQWGLSSRYLSRPEGLAHLSGEPRALLLGCAVVALVPAALGPSGAVAGLLTLTWTGGAVLIRRRWSLPYAATVVLAAIAMGAGAWPLGVLALTAVVTTVGVALAVLTSGDRPTHRPGRWARAGTAALIGLGLGLMLVVDRSISWSLGALPALALLPSTLACFWAGTHLWRFQQVIPHVLSGVAIAEADAGDLGSRPLRLLLGAVARLVLLTGALSALLVLGASVLDAPVSGISVLVGFGLVALATLLVSLLESVGRAAWALLALAVGLGVDSVLALAGGVGVPGGSLIAGASCAVGVAGPASIAVLRDPVTTLATRLGIP